MSTPVKFLVDLDAQTAGYVPLDTDELAQLAADETETAGRAAAATALAWGTLRAKRDRWLAQTDYIGVFIASATPPDLPTAIKDAITANSAAWTTFRQELRDLPANTADPTQPSFPTPPAAPAVIFS